MAGWLSLNIVVRATGQQSSRIRTDGGLVTVTLFLAACWQAASTRSSSKRTSTWNRSRKPSPRLLTRAPSLAAPPLRSSHLSEWPFHSAFNPGALVGARLGAEEVQQFLTGSSLILPSQARIMLLPHHAEQCIDVLCTATIRQKSSAARKHPLLPLLCPRCG